MMSVAIAALLLSTAAQARPGGGPPPPGMVLERNAQELGLSEVEVAAMDAVFESHRETMRAMMDEMKAARDADDRESMRALHQEVESMREAILEEALGTLSADKAGTVRSFFEERRQQGGEGRGSRGGQGRGGPQQ